MSSRFLTGFDKVNELAKEHEANYVEKVFIPGFWIKDGEVVDDVWFNGVNEPLIVPVHVAHKIVNGRERYQTVTCRNDEKGVINDCLACSMAEDGSSSVGPRKYIFVMSVADPRLVHEVTVEGKDYKKVIACNGKVCALCAEGVSARPRGQTKWEMSLKWVQQLNAKGKDLSCVCMCGGRVRDGICRKCGNTDVNHRQNIHVVPFRVTRTGSYKQTAYVISPMPIDDVPEWVKLLPKLDLSSTYPVLSVANQARILGVRYPIKNILKKVNVENIGNTPYEGNDDDALPF